MKQNKVLIKVIGTLMIGASGKPLTQTARGIWPLKRGQTMLDFVSKFLIERGITSYALHQRAEKAWSTSPIMSLNVEPQTVITYHFIEFPVIELGYHAKDLTTDELNRDLKQIKVYG